MRSEALLHRLRVLLTPKSGQQARVRQCVTKCIAVPVHIHEAQKAIMAPQGSKQAIWQRIQQQMEPQVQAQTILENIPVFLQIPVGLKQVIRVRLLEKITQPLTENRRLIGMKWTASFAIVALLITSSPALFLTNTSVADSQVLLVPTVGKVAISVGDMWQDVADELALEAGMEIRTWDGQASILFRDDAVIRLDKNARIVLHDTAARLEPSVEPLPTLSVLEGRIWVQGLVPDAVRGITVSTANGHVTVNEGSVSLSHDVDRDLVAVHVWDRGATVRHAQEERRLVVGEHTQLRDVGTLLTSKIRPAEFTEQWAKSNLAMDAVHRRYIAHLQHERMAASAGILPTSNLYAAKRGLEKLDILLTFNNDSLAAKQVAQAENRLNEAAAMIAQGGNADEIAASITEYKDGVSALSGDGNTSSQFLVKKSLTETISDISAALPGDDSYQLKLAILDTTSDLPADMVDQKGIQTVLLADAITQMSNAIEGGEPLVLEQQWESIQPYLGMLEEDESLATDQRKEMLVMLELLAEEVDEQPTALFEDVSEDLLNDIALYLPEKEVSVVTYFTAEERQQIVQAMLERIYIYSMHRSRENQLRVELAAIYNHPYEGSLLRTLYSALPENSRLSYQVRQRIVTLRWSHEESVMARNERLSNTNLEL